MRVSAVREKLLRMGLLSECVTTFFICFVLDMAQKSEKGMV